MKITHAKIEAVAGYDSSDELMANAFYTDSAGALVLTDTFGIAAVCFQDGEVYSRDGVEYPLFDTKIKKLTLDL